MPEPLCSVIIVAFRSRDEIGPCLASLPTEVAGGFVEVILVDNSRDVDGTVEIARQTRPDVRILIPEENLGFGRANNLGYAHSRGKSVLFLNPDTVSNAQAIEHCLRRILTEPDIGLISPRLELADGTMDLACRRSIPTLWDGFCRATGLAARFPRRALFAGYNLTHLPVDGTYEVGAINGAFMLARREVLDRIAEPSPPTIFDPAFFMYGDDLDLCIRVRRAGLKIIYEGRTHIKHLKGTSVAQDLKRMSRAIFDANRDVYLKHFNPRKNRWIRWKYQFSFGLWKQVGLARAYFCRHRRVRPV